VKLDAILTEIDQLRNLVADQFLITANETYRMSLLFYRSVQSFARLHDEGAMAVYNRLNEFFRRRHPLVGQQETQKEQIKEAKALIKGTKEGMMEIENIMPHTTAGSHAVIEDIHNPHDHESVSICSNCGTENYGHHNFCHHCGNKIEIVES
jgi:hypothetical protein